MDSSRMMGIWRVAFVCLVLAGIPNVGQATLEVGLIAHWDFNSDFFATNGDSLYLGEPINGASIDYDAGFGGAAYFEPYGSQYVAIGAPMVQSGMNHTYSVWYKAEVTGYALDERFMVLESTTDDPLGVGPVSYHLVGADSVYIGRVSSLDAVSQDTVSTDLNQGGGIGWHNLIVTYSATGSEHNIYLDGDLVETMPSSGTLVEATGLNIGGDSLGGNNWAGWIDDVQVWDRILTTDEIIALQGNLALDLYKSLGLDEAWYDSGSVEFTSGAIDSKYYSRLASGFDPVNDTIMLSTGIGQEEGLGDTDLAGDGMPDLCRFSFTFEVPTDVTSIYFTTQLQSTEMDRNRSVDSYEILVEETNGTYSRSLRSGTLPSQNYVDETQPPNSLVIKLNEDDGPADRMLTITFEIEDTSDGFFDSGLAVSWVHLDETPHDDPLSSGEHFRFEAAPPGDSRLAAGSYTFAEDIVSVPSPMPIRFSVMYNSQSYRSSSLGNKWVHSYDISLLQSDQDDDGDEDVLIRHGNGTSSYFDNVGSPYYEPMYPGVKGLLVKINEETFAYMSDAGMGFKFKKGINASFSGVFFVDEIIDRYGNETTFTYNSNDDAIGGQELVEVTSGNHVLQLDYRDFSGQSMLKEISVNGEEIASFRHDEVSLPGTSLVNLESLQYAIYDPMTELSEGFYFWYNNEFPEESLIERVSNSLWEDVVTNEYGFKRFLTVQADGEGYRVTNEYLGTQMHVTDKMNQLTIRHYNADLKLSTLEKPGVGNVTYEYNGDGRITKVTDTLGNETIMDYDDEGNLVYLRDFEGNVITMEYDGDNLVRRTDQAGKDWTFTYDANDNMLSQSDPLGNTTTYVYGDNGLLVSETDPNGHTSYIQHDSYGYVSRMVDPMGAATSIERDPLGNPVAITGPNGYTSLLEHDVKGRRLSLVSAIGGEILTKYDAAGRKTREETTNYPAPTMVTNYVYNPRGLLKEMAHGDDPSYGVTYNPDGNRRSVTDPLGQVTFLNYDNQGRLNSVDSPEGASVTKNYDTCDEVSFVSPNGETHVRTSDSLGRVTSETDPLGNTMSYSYDPRGLLSHLVNGRGQNFSYDYDAAGRLTDMTFPGGGIEHTLDAVGNRTASSSSFYSGVTRQYDAVDRLVSRADGHGRTVGYRYDASGNVIEIIYPDGVSVSYTYDAVNRMTSVTDWEGNVTRYEYTLAGNLTQAILPDSSTVTFDYDSSGRMTSKVDWLPGTGEIFRVDYTFDGASRATHVNRTLPLDPVLNDVADQFSYLADMIEDVNDQNVDYDGDGNMTAGHIGGASMSFEYDPLNRLTKAGADEYGYDVDGLRVWSDIGGQTRQYVHNTIAGTPQVLVEYNEMGSVVARYVYGQGLISRQEPGGDPAVYHFDSRGSAVALVSPEGVITDTYAYGPFGKVLNRTGVTENRFLYCGQHAVMDDGNGLNLMRLRYYAPELMRFIQKDQVERGFANQPQTLNRHAYVMGNPVTRIDPNGDFFTGFSILSAVTEIVVDVAQNNAPSWEEAAASLGAAVLGEIVGVMVTGIAICVVGVGGLTFGTAIIAFVVADLVVWGVMSAITGENAWEYTTTATLYRTGKKLLYGPPDEESTPGFNDFWPDRENFDGGMSLVDQASMLSGAMASSVCPLR